MKSFTYRFGEDEARMKSKTSLTWDELIKLGLEEAVQKHPKENAMANHAQENRGNK